MLNEINNLRENNDITIFTPLALARAHSLYKTLLVVGVLGKTRSLVNVFFQIRIIPIARAIKINIKKYIYYIYYRNPLGLGLSA